MSTVSSISLFSVATLQPKRVRPGFCQSFSALHKYEPPTHSRFSIFFTRAYKSFFAWINKIATATAPSICSTSFHARLQGCTPSSSVERSQERQNIFSVHDIQPSCSTCGLPASTSCPHCEDKFCHSHIYPCRECQILFCGDCLDLHSLDGHWSDSDTARAMLDSIHRHSSPSHPMHTQSSTRHPQRGFASNSFTSNKFTSSRFTSSLASAQCNSRPCSRRLTIRALLSHSARSLFAIFALFSPEVAQ